MSGIDFRLSAPRPLFYKFAMLRLEEFAAKIRQSDQIRRLHRRGHQHGVGHSGFPQPRRHLDALPSGDFSGIHEQRSGAHRSLEAPPRRLGTV